MRSQIKAKREVIEETNFEEEGVE